MAALVQPGAPVSVLIDYGLPETLAEKLVEAGIGSIEKLGAMTPEQLEEIQGIGPKMVEHIQDAVNAYYGQFEAPEEAAAVPEGTAEHAAGVEPAEAQPEETAVEAAPAAETAMEDVAEGEGAGEEKIEPESTDSESGTIKDS